MTERHKQLTSEVSTPSLFQPGIVADYFFLKTLLFAQINLDGHEYRLFQRIFEALSDQLPKPEILIYLHSTVPQCLLNIQKRNRSYELEIQASYLQKIQNQYLTYLNSVLDFPVLMIDASGFDFILQPQLVEQIKDKLMVTCTKGVHHLKFSI